MLSTPNWTQHAEHVVFCPTPGILIFFDKPLDKTVCPNPRLGGCPTICVTLVYDFLNQVTTRTIASLSEVLAPHSAA